MTVGATLETGGFSDTLGNFSIAHIQDFGYLRVFATDEQMQIQVHLWCLFIDI